MDRRIFYSNPFWPKKGLEANKLMAIIRDVFTSKEISQLDEMESVF
ncbi:hypothetical protein [Vagococcus fluvialis]